MRRLIVPVLILAMSGVCRAEEDPAVYDASELQTVSTTASSTMPQEALAKSAALKHFLLNKHDEALTEFRALSLQYPMDIVLKRYIAVCLIELQRVDEAQIDMEMILLAHPNDLPTHKLFAKMRLKRGETAQARRHLQALIDHDTSGGRFAAYGKAQIERIDTIEAASSAASAGALSAQDFMKSPAVVHFMDAKYEDAIKAFETMESAYPTDARVKRYKGIAYDKLGRHDEAVKTFEEGLKAEPENAALRYALAQAHFHRKDMERASVELKRISDGAIISDYKIRADRDLEAIERIEEIRTSIGKKWSFALEQGFEFNSNASSEPTKRRSIDEEHAVRFPGSFYANYAAYKSGPWSLSASYSYSHSMYSDTLDYLQTMANVPSMTVTHMGELAGKPLVSMFSTSYVHLSVAEQFYYQSYPQTFRFIYSYWDWQRMILSERIIYTDYKDQGSAPSATSREGVSNAIGLSNSFFHNKEHTLFTTLGYEFKAEDTDGSDYVRNIHQFTTDFNFPVWRDWTGLVSFRYKDSDYTETTRQIQRQDDEYLIDTRLTIPMSKNTSMKIYYDYLHNDSNDPFYKYSNHSGGASVATYF